MPSTGSGTESNTLIERSRNHRDEKKNVPSTPLRHRLEIAVLASAFVNFVRRPSVCAQASVQLAVKASIIFLSR